MIRGWIVAGLVIVSVFAGVVLVWRNADRSAEDAAAVWNQSTGGKEVQVPLR